jgi:hypothetical protein
MCTKIFIIVFSIAVFWCVACFAQLGGAMFGGSNPQSETVTANLASMSYTIPNNFVGRSQELADVIPGGAPISGEGSLLTSSTTTMIAMAQLLWPYGYIRIGGNSQDTPNDYTSTIP